jgi:hypothetical protein
VKILTDQGYVEAVGVFFELDDEQLDLVRNDKDYYLNKKLIKEFNESKGDNVHFVGLCNNGEGSLIYTNMKRLLNDYKSVSWWDKDMLEFKIERRE